MHTLASWPAFLASSPICWLFSAAFCVKQSVTVSLDPVKLVMRKQWVASTD